MLSSFFVSPDNSSGEVRLMSAALLKPDITNPLAFPILFPDHSKLPKTYIQASMMNPLCDGGLILEQMWNNSGVQTKLDVYPGPATLLLGPFIHADFTKIHTKDLEEGMKWLLGLSGGSKEYPIYVTIATAAAESSPYSAAQSLPCSRDPSPSCCTFCARNSTKP